MTTVDRPTGASAGMRAAVAAAAGAAAGVLVSSLGSWQLGTLVGWDVAAAVYVAWTWRTVWRLDPAETARLSVREDPGRAAADAVLLIASVASLLAIALVIAGGTGGDNRTRDARAALAVVSVVLSWTVVHTVFTLRYARLYYTGPDGRDRLQPGGPAALLRLRVPGLHHRDDVPGLRHRAADPGDPVGGAPPRAAVVPAGAVILATTINLVSGLLR
jgi:uncharacterized membrane protein